MSRPPEDSQTDPSVALLDNPIPGASTLVEILAWRATHQPDRLAYRFLLDGKARDDRLTYAALDARARSISARLRALGETGDRALLVFPPGLDLVSALFGCWYAGMIAVPTYPPGARRTDQASRRLISTVEDAEPVAVLTVSSMVETFVALSATEPALLRLPIELIDEPVVEGGVPIRTTPEDIALLQYTSGSTMTPRGVVVRHGNLMHNLAAIQERFGTTPDSRGVIWLPPYHDMGLIGGVLAPAYTGMPVTLMSPLHFLQRPLRWLQAVSSFKAHVSGGPDFAFELCVQRVTPEERDQLDLSHWDVAFNGAEPVRASTLERFATYFEPSGFRPEAFYPCYGLAEATLIVSGGVKSQRPTVRRYRIDAEAGRVEPAASEAADATVLVGCGRSIGGQEIVITDPETGTHRPPHEIGEIRVTGPSVATEYWNRTEESDRVYRGRMEGDTRRFLRTGDLGFLSDGELFVVGRLKDLVIIDGQNHHPEDIERTVVGSHESLRDRGCAAFSIDTPAGEQLVVVAEVRRRPAPDLDAVARAVRAAVSSRHNLRIHDLSLLDARISRTSSGKIQRHACRREYLHASSAKERADP